MGHMQTLGIHGQLLMIPSIHLYSCFSPESLPLFVSHPPCVVGWAVRERNLLVTHETWGKVGVSTWMAQALFQH